MCLQQNIVFVISVFVLQASNLRAGEEELEVAMQSAATAYNGFMKMLLFCMESSIPNQQFKIDNLQGFINYPRKTTVGVAHKVSSNRKFFANLIATRDFKQMLEKDADQIRKSNVKKIKYCDNVVMNQNTLKDFYDREIDQTKL